MWSKYYNKYRKKTVAMIAWEIWYGRGQISKFIIEKKTGNLENKDQQKSRFKKKMRKHETLWMLINITS